jgi:hypothetical protein
MPWTAARLAARRLVRSPLFTVVTLVTLAVGIGANTAIFSIVHGVLLKPLPFSEPDRLVGLWHKAPGTGFEQLNQSPATYFTYREDGRVFEDLGLYRWNSVSITGRGEPERIQALMVTDGTLPAVGVRPLRGRLFTREDDAPGAPARVILTYGYWQRRFAGADVVGQPITVDGMPLEIVGILPQSFRFLDSNTAIVLPLQLDRAETFIGNFSFRGLARLKPGVTLEQANADVARMLPTLPDRFPLPPGFSRKMLEEIKLFPTCGRSRSTSSATSARCSGRCSARRASCSSSPVRTWRTCRSSGRRRGTRSSRCARRSGRVAGRSRDRCSRRA